MTIDIEIGARLRTAQADDLGVVRRLVVSPSTSDITHVVVEKGLFFPEDRVVPVDTMSHVEGDQVVLKPEIDPSALPRYISQDYTPIEDTERFAPVGAALAWRYPTSLGAAYPAYPVYPIPPLDLGETPVQHTLTGIPLPAGEVIDAQTPVLSIDGDDIGKVAEVEIDDQGHLSHLVVDLGFLNGARVLPAHWVDSIGSDAVRLAVATDALETLETLT